MIESKPRVYIFHGNNRFAIEQTIQKMLSQVGDAAAVSMDVSRFDGRSVKIAELGNNLMAMPFMSDRRVIILSHPLQLSGNKSAKEKFIRMLESVPPYTALVLVQHSPLSKGWGGGRKLHWLEQWAADNSDNTFIKSFDIQGARGMQKWIKSEFNARGGEIESDAVAELATLVGEDTILASNEIDKLLAYANFARIISIDDVFQICVDAREGDIFAFVDALSQLDTGNATSQLSQLLQHDEAWGIFWMVIRQFRLLILAKDVQENGGNIADVQSAHKKATGRGSKFVAEKVSRQARNFRMDTLKDTYTHLANMDLRAKTGKADLETELYMFVSQLASS